MSFDRGNRVVADQYGNMLAQTRGQSYFRNIACARPGDFVPDAQDPPATNHGLIVLRESTTLLEMVAVVQAPLLLMMFRTRRN